MSEFKGTKGKWGKIIYCNKDTIRATIFGPDVDVWNLHNKTNEEVNANALLISKAPEMLEMLKNILLILETPESTINIIPIINLIKEATEL